MSQREFTAADASSAKKEMMSKFPSWVLGKHIMRISIMREMECSILTVSKNLLIRDMHPPHESQEGSTDDLRCIDVNVDGSVMVPVNPVCILEGKLGKTVVEAGAVSIITQLPSSAMILYAGLLRYPSQSITIVRTEDWDMDKNTAMVLYCVSSDIEWMWIVSMSHNSAVVASVRVNDADKE
jgi:hypothetical protein